VLKFNNNPMANICDFCGASGAEFIAIIEGARGFACPRCASLGQVVEEIKEQKPKEKIVKKPERSWVSTARVRGKDVIEEVVEEIGSMVRKEREARGWSMEDLGKRVGEPASLIRRIEHGYTPSTRIAKKIGKVLGLRLTELTEAEEEDIVKGGSSKELTLGDILVIKK